MKSGILIAGAAAMAVSQLMTGTASGVPLGADRPVADVADGVPVIRVQANDPRVLQLEEQVRQLNGRLEELNFLLLQTQEQLRRMQEDNEFRFQELEDKQSGGGQQKGELAPDKKNRVASIDSGTKVGTPPRNLGQIVIGADGSVKGAALGDPMDLRNGSSGPAPGGGSDNAVVAALPTTNDPEQLYSDSYEFILAGDYETAEAGFRRHLERFPDDPRGPDARFWLGESLLSQDKPAEAAEVFLASSQNYPNAKKAPDTLLKLGIALVALNQRDVACATFREIGVRYPDVSDVLKSRVKQEKALAAC